MLRLGGTRLLRLPCSALSYGHQKTLSSSSYAACKPQVCSSLRCSWRTDHWRWASDQSPRYRVPEKRSDLWKEKRVMVKLGSAVITREDECGLALGRLASIVEQVAELQMQKKEMIIVTSGAVAFGKQLLQQESLMSLSLRQNLSQRNGGQLGHYLEPRACAAVGQNGLMSMYDSMFQQYGFKTAQVLVNKKDFENEFSRRNLKSTLSSLCALNTIPIINTNDAMAPPPEQDRDLAGVISIKDNDSLAAWLAVEVGARLLVIMSDVNGLYTAPPGSPDARLLSTYCPNSAIGSSVLFGDKSRVGVGGMDSKVKAATWALNNGTSVVICNGCEENAILKIMNGKNVGTFFTQAPSSSLPAEMQAQQARDGGLKLQMLTRADRSAVINRLADLLLEQKTSILNANQLDLAWARDRGTSQSVMGVLGLSEKKLEALSTELRQTAARFCQVQGQVLRRTKMAETAELTQVTAPVGVVLVISEAQSDTLPQMAALCICSGNGLLMKGGREAWHTNKILHSLVQEALGPFAPPQTVGLVSQHEDISDLLQMHEPVDVLIPRGSPSFVRQVQKDSQRVPVLGLGEGVCHVYVDEDADPDMALSVVIDSKCQNPGASNTMDTLLIHSTHRQGPLFDHICEQLRAEDVDIRAGPQLSKLLKFGRPRSASLKTEYGTRACTVEVVDSVEQAIRHINTHGSGHTNTIVTDNDGSAERFLQLVDSACVFLNASTRLSDCLFFGMGSGYGSSVPRVHARGPAGIESLLTTKWILRGRGQVMRDVLDGTLQMDPCAWPTQDVSETDDIMTHFSNSSSEADLTNEDRVF